MWCWKVKVFSHAMVFPATRLLPRFSSSKLFVGGLSCDTNETALRDAFAEHGEIIEAKVICDRITSESKRYGFVQFSSEEEAATALQKMNGQSVDGRLVSVRYAAKKE